MAQPVGAPGESARPNGGCRTARPLTFPAPGCLGAKIFQVRTHGVPYTYVPGAVCPGPPSGVAGRGAGPRTGFKGQGGASWLPKAPEKKGVSILHLSIAPSTPLTEFFSPGLDRTSTADPPHARHWVKPIPLLT